LPIGVHAHFLIPTSERAKRIFSSIEMTQNLLLNKFHSVEILDNLSVAILRSVTYQNICHTMRSSMPE